MWCPDVMHPCFTGYSDYGDYWRANYEADYPEEYKYSRDQLIKDVEKTFEQVEAGKSSYLGHGVVFCDGGLTCVNVVKKDEICSKLAILSLHGVNRCWETYMTFKSAATLGPAWSPWAAQHQRLGRRELCRSMSLLQVGTMGGGVLPMG